MWIRAMRRCLLCLGRAIRYEQPGICALLRRAEFRHTQQEKELSALLCACADRIEANGALPLASAFAAESARMPSFGVLSREDRQPFEAVLFDLGRCALREQLRLIDEADERLRAREAMLCREMARRVQLIRTLGVCCGGAVFLLMI